MEVKIISREVIKPATPLNGLKTFQISFLDMLSPEVYSPITFFYSMKEVHDAHFNKEDATARLKLSLSETLDRFPILAGRIKGDLIHCSDEDAGALFVEATVKATMADFLKTPDLQLLPQILPFPLVLNQPLETAVQVAAQVNVFSCGGIAVGLSFLHKIIDGTTMSAFIKSWAASTEGTSEKLVCGNYSSSSSLFPARDISTGYSLVSPVAPFMVRQGESSTTRRFVFDAMAISNLKAEARSAIVPNPTVVEAVTCFIWKYAMKASRCRSLNKKEHVESFVDSKWQSVLVHIVNMRRRIQPPLSEHDVGNIFWRSHACYEASNTDANLGDLESTLRQSLSEINDDFIQKAIGDDGFETLLSSLRQSNELYVKGSQLYMFTSWRNMGLNDVNFGWGKPVWITCGGRILDSMVTNVIVLMDTATGREGGIEAWIVLDDETMNLLENDSEFLEVASPNPSIPLA